ncbi:MAG TPA: DUF2142 domain-containing protein [Thermoleophilaceae bacterium]
MQATRVAPPPRRVVGLRRLSWRAGVRRLVGTGPLVPLLGAVAIVVVAWALLVPPFQVPDESGHFGYVQSLAENGTRPGKDPPPGGRVLSTEQRAAAYLARSPQMANEPEFKPAWDGAAERSFAAIRPRPARDDVIWVGNQSDDPPLYYAYEALVYKAASSGDLFTRLYLMRLLSGLLMLVTTAGAWLLAGELTGNDRLLQLVAAGCVGLQPMSTFVSSGVNPDALLFALSSLTLWLGVRVVRRGPTAAGVSGLVAAAGLAPLANGRGLALAPPAALALVLAWRRSGRRVGRSALGVLAAVALLLAAGVASTRGLGGRLPARVDLEDLHGFASYVWQFYLPELPWQRHFPGLGALPVWETWLKTSWAAFGSLDVRLPPQAYPVLAVLTLGTFAGAAAALARRAFRPGAAALAFGAVAVASLLLGLHWDEYWGLRHGLGSSTQGRYLLPLMPIAGVAVAAALSNLGGRGRARAAALVLGGMAVLQLFSLAVVAGRFYA